MAGEFGVVLAVEPHVGSSFDRPEKALWLVRAIDHPGLRLNVDVSHFVAQGLDVGAALELLIPHAAHLHVKDEASARPLRFALPGAAGYDYAGHAITEQPSSVAQSSATS